MKSLRTRLAFYFIFIILVTVVSLEAIIINLVRENYYKNLQESLYNQVLVAAGLYENYFSDTSLYDNVLNNVDTYWKQTTAEVQIIDPSGRLLMDSIGIIQNEKIDTRDVTDALKGEKGTWIGKVDYDTEMVAAASAPLKSRGQVVGALRFISSLREVNKDVAAISRVFILIGAVVTVISVAFSLLLAGTIINPLKLITRAAVKMASGNYAMRCPDDMKDEIGGLSRAMNHMAEEILKREQLKNEFISSVSHELRTPLTSIKGWAVTLKEGCPDDRETLVDGLDIIEKESDRLTEMVEELLDFSKFVTGKITIKREPVDIHELVNYVYRQMAPRAEREEIIFSVNCPMDIKKVITDENRLKQVFINILDNSLRFTQKGGRVDLQVETDGEDLIFNFLDTGCGIPQDELPKIKEKFFKGRNSKSRNGIGLSICDEIIKLMGGTLDIISEVGKGTFVKVAIPYEG